MKRVVWCSTHAGVYGRCIVRNISEGYAKVACCLSRRTITDASTQVRFIDFHCKASVPVSELLSLPVVLGEVPVLTFTASTIACGSEGVKMPRDESPLSVCAAAILYFVLLLSSYHRVHPRTNSCEVIPLLRSAQLFIGGMKITAKEKLAVKLFACEKNFPLMRMHFEGGRITAYHVFEDETKDPDEAGELSLFRDCA